MGRGGVTSQQRELPKYEYPDYVVTAAIMKRWSKYVFGSGLLLSERARAHVWELSDRGRAIVSMLGGDS